MFSDTNLLFTTVWPTVLFVLSVVLVTIEYLIKRGGVVFTVISSLFLAGSAVVYIFIGCSLCDLLVLICSAAALRLFFEIRKGRAAK